MELIQSGIIRIGFQTTGAPNTIGSLMLNNDGKKQTRPIDLSFFNF